MSPVWMINDGAGSRALIRAMACSKVPSASLLASPLKPMCVSLICTKLKPRAGSAAEAGLKARDERTPPVTVQTSPVPAQAMHCRNPRRSTPSPPEPSGLSASRAEVESSFMASSCRLVRVWSLHDDLAGHQGMERAEVLIDPGLRERIRIGLVGLQTRRPESLCRRDHGVDVLVAIQPGDGRAGRHGERRAAELVL